MIITKVIMLNAKLPMQSLAVVFVVVCKVCSVSRMTVSLKFLFQVAWMREHLRERNQMDEEEQGEDRGLFVVPDEVKELKLQREVESLIGNTVDPSKVCFSSSAVSL